jgi:hypothetical protein
MVLNARVRHPPIICLQRKTKRGKWTRVPAAPPWSEDSLGFQVTEVGQENVEGRSFWVSTRTAPLLQLQLDLVGSFPFLLWTVGRKWRAFREPMTWPNA